MLSEINHTEKDKYLFTTYMVNKKKKTENKLIDTKKRLVTSRLPLTKAKG